MPEENHTPANGVSHTSAPFGYAGTIPSERFGNMRKEEPDSFGKLPNASERKPSLSEATPSASERNDPSFPKASESFRSNTPPASETIQEILSRPERRPEHTLSAREVEKLFEQAGRPVTERSILNWCKPNSEGVCRLNCGYERGERRWFITPESVERVIEEERRKEQSFPTDSLEFSEASDRLSESFGKERDVASESFRNVPKEEPDSFGKLRNASERNRQSFRKASETPEVPPPHVESANGHREGERSQETEAFEKERAELQKRIVELEREAAAGEWKDDLITSLRGRLIEDRQDYNERMKFFQTQYEKLETRTERYVEDLVGINRRIGTLEAENRMLRQLPAGKPEHRDADEDIEPIREEPYRDASESAHDPIAIHDQPTNYPPFHV